MEMGFNDLDDRTVCSLCHGEEDEDLIILCDGVDCKVECHMYCLTPILTEVPEGEWFCDACDKKGTTRILEYDIDLFNQDISYIYPKSYDEYTYYMIQLQDRLVPIDQWKPRLACDNPSEACIIESEFDSSAIDLIGCIVKVSFHSLKYYTGRIINRRYDTKLSRWEHLIQFKR